MVNNELFWGSNDSENGRVRNSKKPSLHKTSEYTGKKLSESTLSELWKLIKFTATRKRLIKTIKKIT